MLTPTVLTFLIFLAVTLLVGSIALAAVELLSVRRRAIDKRLAVGQRPIATVRQRQLPAPQRPGRQPVPLTRHIDDWFERLVAESGLSWQTETGLLLALACGLLTGGLLFLWRDNPFVAAAGGAAGIIAVIAAFMMIRSRRRGKMRQQLPDAISLLSRGVQAGESLEQALELVGDHVERPLAYEFQYCHRHLEMGLSVDATMRALTRRVPIVEIQILASTLVVQRRTGGDLPEALESLARVIRDRLNYYRQFRAATAASRVSFIVISLAGPVLAVSMWMWRKEPVEKFLATVQGKELTGLACGLYVIGVAWIFQLLRPRY